MRKVIACIADTDSFFELKPRFGRTAVTGLARLDGRSVGFLASNPMGKAGALDVAGCEKAASFIVHLRFVQHPAAAPGRHAGFVIGIEGERQKAPGKIMNFMQALQMCTVPKLSVILRKSYGQAYLNMGGGRNSDDVAAWPTAEVSFMDPHFATEIVTWGQDIAGRREAAHCAQQMEKDNSAYGLAEQYRGAGGDRRPPRPAGTCWRQLEIHELRRSGGVGQHLMRNWPCTY